MRLTFADDLADLTDLTDVTDVTDLVSGIGARRVVLLGGHTGFFSFSFVRCERFVEHNSLSIYFSVTASSTPTTTIP